MIGGRIGGFSSLFHPGLLLTRRAGSNRPGRGVIIPRVQTLISWNTFPRQRRELPRPPWLSLSPAPLQEAALPPLPGSKAPSTAALCSAFI
ncbi:hypothetical protein PBY51_022606 [Eleginops maclovinus]|uniref:Uncharacterized protein n=1 Tax=Eleginops maclovinus TaxID=56733 RepID=A0AAN8AN73_ELEMC|nr:hypothetical protein PBY51_022606 [Eleginops maclovinus]